MTAPTAVVKTSAFGAGIALPKIGHPEPEFVLVLEDRHQAVSMGARRRGLLYASFCRRGRPAHEDRESRGLTMTGAESEQATPMMTRAEADARFAAMLERQDVAKAEADARFAAMLDRHDAQRAQDRAEFRGEMEARFAQVDARFAELKGEMNARFGEINGRFGEIEGRFGGRFGEIEGRLTGLAGRMTGLEGQMRTLKWTFGSIMAFNTLVLGVLAYTVAI